MNRNGDNVTWMSSRFKLENAYRLAKSALESAAEAFLAVDAEHKPIIYNQKFIDMWGFDPELEKQAEMEGRIQMMAERVKAPGRFREKALELLIDLDIVSRDVFKMTDGRIIQCDTTPYRLSGVTVGRLYRFLDITHRKKAEKALEFRDRILEATVFASKTFLKSSAWEEALPDVLQRIGEAAAVSRVYFYFAEKGKNGINGLSLRNEWAAKNIRSRFDIPDCRFLSLENAEMGGTARILSRGDAIAAFAADFSAAEQTILERLNVLSIALVPVFSGERWSGVLGFDECFENRAWLSTELDALKMAADLLGAALQRKANDDILVQAKETAEQANSAKSMFLASVSHEIRNAMNAVIGLTDLTLKTNLTPRQHNFIKKASASSRNLLGVINDILDLSKIEAGKIEIEHTAFSIRDAMDDIADMFTAHLAEKPLDLIFLVRRNVPFQMIGDPFRIKQVLVNLIGNAFKFSDSGEIVVEAEVNEIKDKSVNIIFSVNDAGIGIAADHILELFTPFTQAGGSITKKYGGTGLGLAISKQLVELMGGSIRVESIPDKGTRFTFDLFMDIADDPVPVPSPCPEQRILVMSGSPMQRKAVIETAAALGVLADETDSTETGASWIEPVMSAEQSYRCVFLDSTAPVFDKADLIKKIRENDRYRNLSVFIMRGGAYGPDISVETPERVFVLHKPVKFRTFIKALTRSSLPDEQNTAGFDEDAINSVSRYFVRGVSVLVAEDDPINREVLIEVLKSEGVQAVTAKDGAEAIRAIREIRFDAVLMDVEMSGVDGFAATQQIRKFEEERRASGQKVPATPIIAMTAHAMVGDKEACLDSGMNDYLTKPIIPDELFRMLEKWTCERQTDGEFENNMNFKETPPKTVETILFNIDGVNVMAGLERLLGNQETYIKLLHNFIRNYMDIPAVIRDKIETRDFDSVLGMIHKIKGTASNLSAEAIVRAASKVETGVAKNDMTAVLTAVDHIEDALAGISESLPGFAAENLNRSSNAGERQQHDTAAIDPRISGVLARLNRCLDEGDSDAETCLPELKKTLHSKNLNDMYARLETQITTFEFGEAKKTLRKIEDGFNL